MKQHGVKRVHQTDGQPDSCPSVLFIDSKDSVSRQGRFSTLEAENRMLRTRHAIGMLIINHRGAVTGLRSRAGNSTRAVLVVDPERMDM